MRIKKMILCKDGLKKICVCLYFLLSFHLFRFPRFSIAEESLVPLFLNTSFLCSTEVLDPRQSSKLTLITTCNQSKRRNVICRIFLVCGRMDRCGTAHRCIWTRPLERHFLLYVFLFLITHLRALCCYFAEATTFVCTGGQKDDAIGKCFFLIMFFFSLSWGNALVDMVFLLRGMWFSTFSVVLMSVLILMYWYSFVHLSLVSYGVKIVAR